MSRYDVNSANTNRIVRFRVEPANAADRIAALFGSFKGRANSYPHYEQLTGTPTANQELAQLRTSLVVRAMSTYAPIVGMQLADDSAGTGGLTANFAPAIIVSFETDESGVFFNNSWTGDTTLAKHAVADIADTVGVGGAASVKTKSGLQSLVDALYSVSYDGGTTGPFGNLSNGGAIVLPDGQTTAGAPDLDNNGAGIGATLSGLTVAFLAD